MPRTTIDTFRFDKIKNTWTRVPGGIWCPYKSNKLEIVSYNVWFDDYNFDERSKLLLNLIKDCDVICLKKLLQSSSES